MNREHPLCTCIFTNGYCKVHYQMLLKTYDCKVIKRSHNSDKIVDKYTNAERKIIPNYTIKKHKVEFSKCKI